MINAPNEGLGTIIIILSGVYITPLAAKVDKGQPKMTFCGRNGYNSQSGQLTGCCAVVDYVARWGTERSNASQTPSIRRPCIGDLPWSLFGFGCSTFGGGGLVEHKRILIVINSHQIFENRYASPGAMSSLLATYTTGTW